MGQIIDTVIEYLEHEAWKYDIEEGGTVVHTGIRGDNGIFHMNFLADEEATSLTLLMSTGTTVPSERRPAVAEYLNGVNWRLSYGSLQMDPNDGEVVYHVAVYLEGGVLSTAMVDHMVAAAITTVDPTFPGLMAVAFAGQDPMELLSTLDGPDDERPAEVTEELPVV